MYETKDLRSLPKAELYAELLIDAESLLEEEYDMVANAANLAALIYHGLPDLNWAGFYFVQVDQLVLGPFQGKVACVRIDRGRGVCGTAWAEGRTVIVPDVHAFPDHIACDHVTQSEIVVPLLSQGRVMGVLDLDSERLGRFDEEDARGLEALVERYVRWSIL